MEEHEGKSKQAMSKARNQGTVSDSAILSTKEGCCKLTAAVGIVSRRTSLDTLLAGNDQATFAARCHFFHCARLDKRVRKDPLAWLARRSYGVEWISITRAWNQPCMARLTLERIG